MKVTRSRLESAVAEEIISKEQADRLSDFLRAPPSTGPSFDLTHVLYYMGGFVAISAMSVFMGLGWERFGGWGIFFISLAYMGAGLKLAAVFQRKGHAVPAGICATFVVVLTPLAIYGLQLAAGWWPEDAFYRGYHRYIRWHWTTMELGTLAVGAIVCYIYRYPFLQLPIAATLWYMSMDVASVLTGGNPEYGLVALVSMYFGLAMILFAFLVDVRSAQSGDYAFWLYLFGVAAFWGGLTSQPSDSELSKFLYFCINLILIGVGVILVRRVFVIFGAVGCAIYLGHLAEEVFEDSWFFPMALTAMGFGIICLGVLWQKKEKEITLKVRRFLPAPVRELLAGRR